MHGRNRKRIIMFGGTGFVGRHLSIALCQKGHEVVIVSRRPHRHRHLLVLPTLNLVEGNIHDCASDDCASISSLVDGADVVINLIGILNESSGNDTFERVHARFPGNLAATCIERQVGRLIHVSSLGARVEAPSNYLRSKNRGETAVVAAMDRGLAASVFRPSLIYGPDGGITQMYEKLFKISRGFIPVICPDSQFQPIYVKDLAQCIVSSLNSPQSIGNCYDVAGPEVYSLFELVSMINELGGYNLRLIPVSDSMAKLLASFMQFLPGTPLTKDNLLSMTVPSVTEQPFPEFHSAPLHKLQQTARTWLRYKENRIDSYRMQAGR